MFHAKYLSSISLGFSKEAFFCFDYFNIKKINESPGGPILTPGLLFEQTW
jgi:hypothetical protein